MSHCANPWSPRLFLNDGGSNFIHLPENLGNRSVVDRNAPSFILGDSYNHAIREGIHLPVWGWPPPRTQRVRESPSVKPGGFALN